MIVEINGYKLETENIVKFYPCDILGNYQEQSKYTYIKDVEYTFEEAFQKTVCENKLYCPARPQGEWIFKHNSSDIWCSVCNENFDEIPQAFNFCPNCGADMRGKADQLRDCENCIHHSDNGCEVWECEFEKRSDV